ncbi:MAG TPA: protease complex subunit PrcB family protein [Polyangiaceae bacterium]|nr:protease complex subunit PrcB family protein [Polyangiaceae bacterium]
MAFKYWLSIVVLAWGAAAAGCAAEFAESPDPECAKGQQIRTQEPSSGSEARAVSVAIPFDDPNGIGSAGEQETRELIVRNKEYVKLFGHKPPPEVDFAAGDVVIFYSAGVQRTGGYVASLPRVELRGQFLSITTRLESPGPGCAVTLALTKPFVLAKVRVRGHEVRAQFKADDVVRDCRPKGCEGVECAKGERCELHEVVCVRAPCDPVPVCVADVNGPFCGGIAGRPCPGAGSCVDDPDDTCDPNEGGADCGGMCVCAVQHNCGAGQVFDSSPGVCACVPQKEADPAGSED